VTAETGKTLRVKLAERRGMLVPGASNALAARVIEDLGFEAVYVSGAGVTNAFWGVPDLGFISLTELAQHTTAIREAVEIPVLVDADTGFGNALNVRHTVRVLERAGADLILLCTNTMHKVAADIQASLRIPFVHIVDATAERIKAQGLTTVAVLGTRFTMEEDFYVGRLTQRHGLRVLIPETAERALIHRVIYDELCLGEIKAASRAQYLAVIDRLIDRGAQGVILGCTEIGLLVQADDCRVPVFDTTRLHAQAAVELALLV
jgi:aspartate racemase